MSSSSRLPSPAFVLATIALLVALAGSAIALPGKNSVDKNDIQKNAVRSKAIKNGQVKAADIADGAVGTGKLADGAVTAGKLAAGAVSASQLPQPEGLHVVGAAGEPAFGTGGDGDCEWRSPNGLAGFSGYDPPSFYRDPFGIVHLTGTAGALDDTGGDGTCQSFGPGGQLEDGIVFTLPAGYRPTGLQTHEVQDTLFWITPAGGAEVEGVSLPGSVVIARDDGFVTLDGITYRAGS
jgi:hypothetical protein